MNIGSYNIVGWNAGCSPSGICGTASDAGSGLDRVDVSIQRSSDSLYWNGSSFASASEDWQNAGGASWNLGFAAAAFPANGSYTIRVRARDLAGNVEAAASRTFTIDTTPPDTSIDSGPANPTNGQDPTFAFSGGPGGVTFECRLDGGSWSACGSPKGYTGLAAGSHTFEARAQDGAGNVDQTPAAQTWTIDLTAPSSAIAFPANGGSYNGAGWNNPSGTALDGVGLDRVEVSLQRVADSLYWNGTAFADGSENWRTATGTGTWSLAFTGTSFPADGDYSIRVRAVDAAGNVEAPSSRTFTVDTVPPETTIDTSPATSNSRRRRVLHLLRRPAGVHLPVPHRRRRVVCVHQPEDSPLAWRRLPRLRGPGDGRRRQRRSLPRLAHVGRRHGTACRDDGRPRPVPSRARSV